MARGQSWPKADLDRWVEQWWSSKLTSLEFVKAQVLPISARTLRSHGERHFGEVMREIQEFRALALALAPRPVAAEANPQAGCQVVESTSVAAGVEPSMPEPSDDKTAKPEPFFFDFSAEDDGGAQSALESRQVANSEKSPAASSLRPSQSPELVRQVASQRSSGPFLFEVEGW